MVIIISLRYEYGLIIDVTEKHKQTKELKLGISADIANAEVNPETRERLTKFVNDGVVRKKLEIEENLFGGKTFPEVSDTLGLQGMKALHQTIVELKAVVDAELQHLV